MSKKCQEDTCWPIIIRLHYSGHQFPCKDLYIEEVQFSDYVQYCAFFYCLYITIKTFSTEGDCAPTVCLLNAKSETCTYTVVSAQCQTVHSLLCLSEGEFDHDQGSAGSSAVEPRLLYFSVISQQCQGKRPPFIQDKGGVGSSPSN